MSDTKASAPPSKEDSVASTVKERSPTPMNRTQEGQTCLEASPQRRERSEDVITPSMERAAATAATQRYEYMRSREDLIKRKSNKLLIDMFNQRIGMMLAECKIIVERGVKATSVVHGIRPYLHMLAPDLLFRKTAERIGRDRASIHIDVGTGKHAIYTFIDEESERHKVALEFLQECAGRQQSLFDSHLPRQNIQDMHAMRIQYAATSALLQNLNDLLAVMRDQYTIVMSTTAAMTAIRTSGLLDAGVREQSNESIASVTEVVSSDDDDE